jgi:hypothetical protein
MRQKRRYLATATSVCVAKSAEFEGIQPKDSSVGHEKEKGTSDPESKDSKKEDGSASLRDTAPGLIPEMELSRTLPTGAAFHATWRIPNLLSRASDPAQESGVHEVEHPSNQRVPQSESDFSLTSRSAAPHFTSPTATTMSDDSESLPSAKASFSPPRPHRGTTQMPFSIEGAPAFTMGSNSPHPEASQFGSTRREFGAVKIGPREKAKRNVLTHTLQMPLVVSRQPSAAPDEARSRPRPMSEAPQRARAHESTAPAGWTSMHRVGSGVPPEPTSTRPPSARGTERMAFGQTHAEFGNPDRARDRDHDSPSVRVHPSLQPEAPAFTRAPLLQPISQDASAAWTQLRTGEYERIATPESAVRIPELSAREWMFIGLLACASAATLYSLLVDDVTTTLDEETVEAATTIEHEHVVTPAVASGQDPQSVRTSGKPAAAAAAANTTEIVSEPSSAEIVVGGAVIGNTPAQVVRGPSDADYLLRKPGYEPQLVRVTPHSPKMITITLHPK